MPKCYTFRYDFLKLIFYGTPIPNLADNAQTDPATDLYISLHTADPISGDQLSDEIAYTGYSRIVLPRNNTAWSLTDNVIQPIDVIEFGKMTGGAGGIATHVGIGLAASGSGYLIFSGELSPHITVAANTIPRIDADTTITET